MNTRHVEFQQRLAHSIKTGARPSEDAAEEPVSRKKLVNRGAQHREMSHFN